MIVLHVYIIINHDKVEESDHSRFDLWPLTPHKMTLTFPFVIFLFSLLKNKIIKGEGKSFFKEKYFDHSKSYYVCRLCTNFKIKFITKGYV